MKVACLKLVALVALMFSFSTPCYSLADISYNGATIVTTDVYAKMPKSVTSNFTVEVKDLTGENLTNAISLVKEEISKYPTGFFGKYCKKVYLTEVLIINGSNSNGITAENSGEDFIVIKYKPTNTFRTRSTVHHEFASRVLTANKSEFNQAAWNRLTTILPYNSRLVMHNTYDREYALKYGYYTTEAANNFSDDYSIVYENMMLKADYYSEAITSNLIKQKSQIISDFFYKVSGGQFKPQI